LGGCSGVARSEGAQTMRGIRRLALAGMIFGIFSVSLSAEAVRQSGSERVLVVVDIQRDCTGDILKPPFLFQNGSDQYIARLNELIEQVSVIGVPVIYLRTNLKMQEAPGAALDPRLKVVGQEIFLKDSFDAFAASNHLLSLYLSSNPQVKELDLVGLDATLCVFQTAKGAVRKGYRAVVVMDAIETMTGKSTAELQAMYRKDSIQTTQSEELLLILHNCPR
jgi:nicotinamidase/pyrazinamidase